MMKLSKSIIAVCLVLLASLPSPSALAGFITFDPLGIWRQDFGPPDGTGALEFRTASGLSNDVDTTNIITIPQSSVPASTVGQTINAANSPIVTVDGNPGIARVVTDLSVGHGNGLGNLESDGSTPPPQNFAAAAGILGQSFSATGTWRLHLDPGDELDFVSLDGNLRADVRLDPPLFGGNASALVSGSVRIDPFGFFMFSTQERSSGGSFGLTISATGGGITFSPAPGIETLSTITFTDLRRDIEPEHPYTFALTGALNSSLSSTGLGGAFSIANLWTELFELRVVEHAIPEPSTLMLFGLVSLALLRLAPPAREQRESSASENLGQWYRGTDRFGGPWPTAWGRWQSLR